MSKLLSNELQMSDIEYRTRGYIPLGNGYRNHSYERALCSQNESIKWEKEEIKWQWGNTEKELIIKDHLEDSVKIKYIKAS